MTYPIGFNGTRAAQAFKQVPQDKRHAETIQYSPSGSGKQALSDLITYAQSFANESDRYTANDIANATGLDLTQLPNPSNIEKIWDINRDGNVDTAEMITGLAHLDFADDSLDGKITEAGRNAVEISFAGMFQQFAPQIVQQMNDAYQHQLQQVSDSAEMPKHYANYQRDRALDTQA